MNVVVGAISSSSSATALRFNYSRFLSFSFSKTLISSPFGRGRRRKNIHEISSPTLPMLYTTTKISSSASTAEGEFEVKSAKPQPWLIVGLGFEMVDTIAEAEGISMSSVSFKSLFGRGFIGTAPVMLAKPQTFMNASGESVKAIVSYYKIPLKQVLVIYDDLDLPFAKLRLLPKGGHGGHNGMKSVINQLKGSRDFPRLRIGIGRPPGKMDPVNFVLRQFNKQEREELDFTFQNGLEAVQILLRDGFEKSATFVNSAKSVEHFG
ncbi:hypothetical protein LguiA_027940 [Lonicera macranthoides]